LPLNKSKIKTIAVIGPEAYPAVPVGGGSAQVVPLNSVSALEGLSNYLGMSARVTYVNGLMSFGRATITTDFSRTTDSNALPGLSLEVFDNENLSGTPTSTRVDHHVSVGQAFDITTINLDEIDFSDPLNFKATCRTLDRILRSQSPPVPSIFSCSRRLLTRWLPHVPRWQAALRQLDESKIRAGSGQRSARCQAAQNGL
jgi:hypothetical protein